MSPKKLLPADAYTIGLIYVKPLEMNAITVMLDEEYERVSLAMGDKNEYVLGRIGKHNVAIVGPARGAQGKVAIADVVASIHWSFNNISIGLLVGIGGGVPHLPKQDVRLGDVVVGAPEVGPAVVQYDLGKETTTGFEVTKTLNKPPALMLRVVNAVEDKYLRQKAGDESFFTTHLRRFNEFPRLRERYRRPSALDRLFLADYRHEPGSDCNKHDKQFEIQRAGRNPADEVYIHYGTILSGDRVMKSEITRDKISGQFHNAICFEMEAAGLMDEFPCLVVRGICDYSDSHKNKDWQEYGAATAASYTRELLLNMSERIVPGLERPVDRDMEAKDNDGLTALHRAARDGDQEEVQRLLENGANIAARDKENRAALFWAAREGHDDVVLLLLDRGANIHARVSWGSTALHEAAAEGNEEVVRVLLNRGARVTARNKFGNMALHSAARRGQMGAMRLLLERGSDIEAAGDHGFTPLHQAARDGQSTAALFLLQNGANPKSLNKDALTPSQVAVKYGHKQVMKSIEEYT